MELPADVIEQAKQSGVSLMAGEERWYFTKEEINNSPSRKCGIDAEKELSYRQQGAKLIQDMGQRLQVYPFGR